MKQTRKKEYNTVIILTIMTYAYNFAVTLLFILLAMHFEKWWLSIFAIFFIKDSVRYNSDNQNEHENIIDTDEDIDIEE